ncbi:MAG: HRDC domain-containing protein [Oscillospiraceae bacterium]|nr:HRDC domain-containing protein [Oscillospiraceae bacterium]
MAARQPATMEEFMKVSGVGAVKAQRYGNAFLDAIADWKRTRAGD